MYCDYQYDFMWDYSNLTFTSHKQNNQNQLRCIINDIATISNRIQISVGKVVLPTITFPNLDKGLFLITLITILMNLWELSCYHTHHVRLFCGHMLVSCSLITQGKSFEGSRMTSCRVPRPDCGL